MIGSTGEFHHEFLSRLCFKRYFAPSFLPSLSFSVFGHLVIVLFSYLVLLLFVFGCFFLLIVFY